MDKWKPLEAGDSVDSDIPAGTHMVGGAGGVGVAMAEEEEEEEAAQRQQRRRRRRRQVLTTASGTVDSDIPGGTDVVGGDVGGGGEAGEGDEADDAERLSYFDIQGRKAFLADPALTVPVVEAGVVDEGVEEEEAAAGRRRRRRLLSTAASANTFTHTAGAYTLPPFRST